MPTYKCPGCGTLFYKRPSRGPATYCTLDCRRRHSLPVRLAAKTSRSASCWIWLGACRNGYGVIGLGGGRVGYCHRLVYEAEIGPIPPGLYVLHSCDVRACVNPDHLFTGSAADNTNDMMTKGRHKNAPLTPREVLSLRDQAGTTSYHKLASRFGISRTAAWRAGTGRTYRHI